MRDHGGGGEEAVFGRPYPGISAAIAGDGAERPVRYRWRYPPGSRAGSGARGGLAQSEHREVALEGVGPAGATATAVTPRASPPVKASSTPSARSAAEAPLHAVGRRQHLGGRDHRPGAERVRGLDRCDESQLRQGRPGFHRSRLCERAARPSARGGHAQCHAGQESRAGVSNRTSHASTIGSGSSYLLNLKLCEMLSTAPVAGSVAPIRLTSLNLPVSAFSALSSALVGLEEGPTLAMPAAPDTVPVSCTPGPLITVFEVTLQATEQTTRISMFFATLSLPVLT